MSGGFNVSTGELQTHASTVAGVAGDVGQAASAAATERAGGLVYGVLFDGLALPFLNMWADSIHGSISAAQRTGSAIASGLRSNADTYDSTESANAATITKSGSEK